MRVNEYWRWIIIYVVGTLAWLSLFWIIKNKLPLIISKSSEEIMIDDIIRIKTERKLNCIEKTKIYPFKQTGDCRVLKGISADGQMSVNDCHILDWPYYEIQCGSDTFWGWGAWSTSEDKKNVWIEGKQYDRSCMYSEENEFGCEYDFNKWPKLNN